MAKEEVDEIELSLDAWTRRPIAQLLGAVASIIRRSAGRTYPTATGLTKGESEVLHAIDQYGPAAARDISVLTTLNEGQVSGIVKTLTTRDLIRRTSDPNDTRRYLLTLTAAGRAKLKKVHQHLRKRQQLLLEGISPVEQAQFFATLLKVLSNAKRIEAREENARSSREVPDRTLS